MVVTLFGIVTLSRLTQRSNMEFEMAVTLSDNVAVVRPPQPSNAYSPMFMLVLPASNVTVVRLGQPEKARFPMPVTFGGIVRLAILLQP